MATPIIPQNSIPNLSQNPQTPKSINNAQIFKTPNSTNKTKIFQTKNSMNKTPCNLKVKSIRSTRMKCSYSSAHKSMAQVVEKGSQMLVQSMDQMNSTNLKMMDKQLSF